VLQFPGILAQSFLPVSLLFFSSSPIALPLFQALLSDKRFEVRGLVCQPDRPVGRGQSVVVSEIKSLALEHGIPVHQPEKLRLDVDLLESLKNHPPDFLLTFAYGQILSEAWLGLARLAPLNIHPSLLPHYRGPTPIQAALLNGDEATGITLMKMVPEMDAGPVAAQIRFPIEKNTTAEALFAFVSLRAREWIPEALLKLYKHVEFFEQDLKEVSFCSMLSKEDAYVDFKLSAELLLRRSLAYTPWPGLWTRWNGKLLKLFGVKAMDQNSLLEMEQLKMGRLEAGHFLLLNGKLFVGTSSDPVELEALQVEGKKRLKALDFLQGQPQFLEVVLPS
jgi:methionyl-tRNA formyltransferase